jgi:hypothetical protein
MTESSSLPRAYERGFSRYIGSSVRDPESLEGACESLKDPIGLAIDILFLFFHFLGIFNYFYFI